MSWLELGAVLVILGALLTALAGLGSLTYFQLRRVWYRWRCGRECSKVDRVSLEALARMERKR